MRPAPKPAAPAFVRLEIEPEWVRLEGPAAAQRVLVTGVRKDGSRADVTSAAKLRLAGTPVVRVEGNRLAATADGRAQLVAALGSVSIRVPVEVRGASRPVAYSFQNDVVPVLARLGCSSGTCHGANSGKGGFKLSLRGYAPELDFLWITRQYGGRRISREAPETSLLLRKPLMEVAHAGGKRVEKGSREYAVLLGWLRQGAPGPDPKDPKLTELAAVPGDRIYRPGERQRVLVRATFSDGHTEDVTDRAIFRATDTAVAEMSEGGEITAQNPGSTAVQAKYLDRLAVLRVTVPFPQEIDARRFPQPASFVDEAVYARLRELNLEPSPACTDEEFLRRVYLDAIGTLPTAEETRAFLAECAEEVAGLRGGEVVKSTASPPTPVRPGTPPPHQPTTSPPPAVKARARLIDRVLARPEYGSVWALKLADLFLMRKEHMGRKSTLALHQWLTEQFQRNRPWDQLVTDLVTATGATSEKPETLWWVSRQMTKPGARGWVRHPELTGEIVAQVFLGQRIQCAKCHNHPTEKYTQDDYYRFAALFAQVNGEGKADPVPALLLPKDKGEARNPRTGELMPAMPLDRTPLGEKDGEDRRLLFARWLTGPGKELFSRNIVNRIWARLFGSGIVDPVDDLRSTNPPRNEALLDGLAKELIAKGYDLKAVTATIMRSNTYQASSVPTPRNKIDLQFFSHYPVRRIQGEELLDAIAQVTGVPDRFASYAVGTRAIELSDSELPSLSLDVFGRPPRVMPCDCERTQAPSMSQALDLFNGEALQRKLKDPEGTTALLAKSGKKDEECVEELFLSAFSRRPGPKERSASLRALKDAPSREEGLQDVLWALINSKEFMFQH